MESMRGKVRTKNGGHGYNHGYNYAWCYGCNCATVSPLKTVFKLLSFLFIFAVLQFPDSIKFISSLNTTVTVVFSDRYCLAYKGAKIVAI